MLSFIVNTKSQNQQPDYQIFDKSLDLTKISTWIFDLDGVVYRGDDKLDSCINFLNFIRRKGKKTLFYSNNSSRTPEFYADKISKMGFPVSPSEVYTSSIIAGIKLKKIFSEKPDVSCYIVGEHGLFKSMKDAGFHIINDKYNSIELDEQIPKDLKVDFVITGIDQHFTYGKLRLATDLIFKGVKFYATNLDATVPIGDSLWPGAGSINASIATATSKKPDFVFGKPSSVGFEIIMEKEGATATNTVIIGDRLNTDILGAINAKIFSIMVGTGVSTLDEVLDPSKKPDEKIIPSLYVRDLSIIQSRLE